MKINMMNWRVWKKAEVKDAESQKADEMNYRKKRICDFQGRARCWSSSVIMHEDGVFSEILYRNYMILHSFSRLYL